MTDEEYRQRLEAQTEQIDNAILEACRTKRRNLFRTGPVAARIGQQFAKRAKAFDMEVYAYDPYMNTAKAEELGVDVKSNWNKADIINAVLEAESAGSDT